MRMREAASAIPAMAMPMLVPMMANWQESILRSKNAHYTNI